MPLRQRPARRPAHEREQMQEHANKIEGLVKSGVMPPGNTTAMTQAEREQLVAWAAARR